MVFPPPLPPYFLRSTSLQFLPPYLAAHPFCLPAHGPFRFFVSLSFSSAGSLLEYGLPGSLLIRLLFSLFFLFLPVRSFFPCALLSTPPSGLLTSIGSLAPPLSLLSVCPSSRFFGRPSPRALINPRIPDLCPPYALRVLCFCVARSHSSAFPLRFWSFDVLRLRPGCLTLSLQLPFFPSVNWQWVHSPFRAGRPFFRVAVLARAAPCPLPPGCFFSGSSVFFTSASRVVPLFVFYFFARRLAFSVFPFRPVSFRFFSFSSRLFASFIASLQFSGPCSHLSSSFWRPRFYIVLLSFIRGPPFSYSLCLMHSYYVGLGFSSQFLAFLFLECLSVPWPGMACRLFFFMGVYLDVFFSFLGLVLFFFV